MENNNVVASKKLTEKIDSALGLTSISIRLPTELINDFKILAGSIGLGYQILMRETLREFADKEIKKAGRKVLNRSRKSGIGLKENKR